MRIPNSKLAIGFGMLALLGLVATTPVGLALKGECTSDCQQCLRDCTPTPTLCEVQCPPTTEVPFFPGTTSLALGALGAIAVLGLVVMRRR